MDYMHSISQKLDKLDTQHLTLITEIRKLRHERNAAMKELRFWMGLCNFLVTVLIVIISLFLWHLLSCK